LNGDYIPEKIVTAWQDHLVAPSCFAVKGQRSGNVVLFQTLSTADRIVPFSRLTHNHALSWRSAPATSIYQGRFKAFPTETDDYFYAVVR
jgi:hypothetical protein